ALPQFRGGGRKRSSGETRTRYGTRFQDHQDEPGREKGRSQLARCRRRGLPQGSRDLQAAVVQRRINYRRGRLLEACGERERINQQSAFSQIGARKLLLPQGSRALDGTPENLGTATLGRTSSEARLFAGKVFGALSAPNGRLERTGSMPVS